MDGFEYKQLFASEGFGGGGSYGIKILVAASNLPDLSTAAINFAAYEAANLVTAEVRAAIIAQDPVALLRKKNDRENLLAIFPGRIFVEAIPNGYSSDWHSRHLPWFVVTTEIGRFKIGWRKRVIHLEWTETICTETAEQLFPSEDVTKDGRMIHAYGYDKARQYVEAIIASAKDQQP